MLSLPALRMLAVQAKPERPRMKEGRRGEVALLERETDVSQDDGVVECQRHVIELDHLVRSQWLSHQ